jgi:predicted metal-dependent hydrolase
MEECRWSREVIVRELLHLRYTNHGGMFKALLRLYLGEK